MSGWKKALRETQTPRTGRSNAEPKNFAPSQTPFPGVQDGQNLVSWKRYGWTVVIFYRLLQVRSGLQKVSERRTFGYCWCKISFAGQDGRASLSPCQQCQNHIFSSLWCPERALGLFWTLWIITIRESHLPALFTFTYRPSLVKIDARNFDLSW